MERSNAVFTVGSRPVSPLRAPLSSSVEAKVNSCSLDTLVPCLLGQGMAHSPPSQKCMRDTDPSLHSLSLNLSPGSVAALWLWPQAYPSWALPVQVCLLCLALAALLHLGTEAQVSPAAGNIGCWWVLAQMQSRNCPQSQHTASPKSHLLGTGSLHPMTGCMLKLDLHPSCLRRQPPEPSQGQQGSSVVEHSCHMRGPELHPSTGSARSSPAPLGLCCTHTEFTSSPAPVLPLHP